jgi:hypothetical protein
MTPINIAMSVRPATLAGLRVYACSARCCSTQYWFHTSVGYDLNSCDTPHVSCCQIACLHGNSGTLIIHSAILSKPQRYGDLFTCCSADLLGH